LVATGKGERGFTSFPDWGRIVWPNLPGAGRVGLQKWLLRRVRQQPFQLRVHEHASTAAMPAYLPVDGHDLHVALTEIDRGLHALYPIGWATGR